MVCVLELNCHESHRNMQSSGAGRSLKVTDCRWISSHQDSLNCFWIDLSTWSLLYWKISSYVSIAMQIVKTVGSWVHNDRSLWLMFVAVTNLGHSLKFDVEKKYAWNFACALCAPNTTSVHLCWYVIYSSQEQDNELQWQKGLEVLLSTNHVLSICKFWECPEICRKKLQWQKGLEVLFSTIHVFVNL